MTKNEKWEALIAFIDQLKEEQFDYATFVSKHENGCGTVCCIGGWFPKLFPDDWEWIYYKASGYNIRPKHEKDYHILFVSDYLANYLNIETWHASALFYGVEEYQKHLGLPIVPALPSTLEMVRDLFHTYANKFIFIHEEPT